MPHHDQLFKDLLEQFFPDFLSIMAPTIRARLAHVPVTFLRGESFSDQPTGGRRTVDLLARIQANDDSQQLVLVHVEIEREARNLSGARMLRYYKQLTLKHPEPVLPIALHLTGGKGGIQRQTHHEEVWELSVCHFMYLALGLAKAEAETFLERPEPLAWGLAALMKPVKLKRWELKLEALSRIAHAQVSQLQQFLLLNIVNTYATLKGDEAQHFEAALATDAQREVKNMQMTWADQLEARGEAQGEAKATIRVLRNNVQLLLERRFGPLPKVLVSRLAALESAETLQSLFSLALDVKSLEPIQSALDQIEK